MPFIVWSLGRQDAFFLQTAFPWIILIPILTTSRYATWYGIASLAVLSLFCLSYVFLYQPTLLSDALEILAGTLLLILLVGEMIQRWKQRSEQQTKQLLETQKSAVHSKQALQLLHISYSQLEEALVTTTQSLTGSLRLIELTCTQDQTKAERLEGVIYKLRDILQQYEWLESAAFYPMNNKGGIVPKALTHIGAVPMNLHQDPLLKVVIRSKKAIQINRSPLLKDSQLQAGIPLVDNHQRLWGVLAVVRMTPSGFRHQNLNLLVLLCNYVANRLSNSQHSISQPKILTLEISTAVNIVLNTVTSLTLVSISLPNSTTDKDYQTFFSSKIRGANRIWTLKKLTETTLIILLPLFNKNNTQQWRRNLENTFIKQFGHNFNEASILLNPHHFEKEDLKLELKQYLDRISEFDHAHLIY